MNNILNKVFWFPYAIANARLKNNESYEIYQYLKTDKRVQKSKKLIKSYRNF